jgi:LDH2 family malate/lactate/ureidoglycolate dehydrogenase
MLVMHHAARAAIAKAEAHGFAVLAVTNSWMSGRSAYYVEMIARADLVAIHTAAAGLAVAPAGGLRPALGTNPIAFGMPSATGPVVFDMGTSAFMMTDLSLRERMGQLLPEGVAIDSAGRPTRDPAAAREGAVLPFGGYKGFGLALMVAALGLLAGPEAGDDGYLFIVFKPGLLLPLDQYKHGVSELVERIKSIPRLPGVDEIRIPGERAFRSRERLSAEGIEIDRLVHDRLRALCA